MIPKQLFQIWIGDNIPKYAIFSNLAYKKLNKDFEIIFLHLTTKDLFDIYINGHSICQYDNEIKTSIDCILDKNDKYTDFVKIQTNVYGKNIRVIQLLSDILRLELLNTYGGIYVDCDTYPVKSFDEQLLSYNKFVVERHFDTGFSYNTNQLHIDNYFFGTSGKKDDQIYNYEADDKIIKLLQTSKNWFKDIQYIYRKKQFFNQKLTNKMFNDKSFYIEHYHDNNWKINNLGKIRSQLCFLDKMLKKV